MIKEQDLQTTLNIQKQMYFALSEISELTDELAECVRRKDQVSIRLFLSMRLEQINKLNEYDRILKNKCESLPKDESDALRDLLNGTNCFEKSHENVFNQAKRNKVILQNIINKDKRASQILTGPNSFYK